MDINWYKHIKDSGEQENFRREVLSSKMTLDRLSDILTDLENDLDRSELNPKFYEIPNWDYRQASNNGYRRAIQGIKKLIDLDQKGN